MLRNWKVFAIGVFLSANVARATITVGFAGDSMSNDPTFLAKLSTTGFNFRQVTSFDASQLSDLQVLWLDGFSIFNPDFNGYDLSSPALSTFVSNNHILIVQSPGLGGNSIEEYPFSANLTLQPAGSEATVRIQKGDTFLVNVNNAQLSNWADNAQPGYFDGIADFTGLADNGNNGQWLTISKSVGSGFEVYTFQDISRNIGTAKEADALALLKSLVVPEPSTNALLIAAAGLIAWNLRRKLVLRRLP